MGPSAWDTGRTSASSIVRLIGVGLALGACAGAMPPRGPHHDPIDSPEPTTVCPSERDAAVAARQRLLEPGGAAAGARTAAATAVLRHAACEGRAVVDGEVAVGTRVMVLASLRQLRERYATATNLHDEVAGYGLIGPAVAAQARQAELGQAMTTLLATMTLPVDVSEAGARAELRAEQAELVSIFGGEAIDAAERALATAAAGGASDPPAASDVAAACAVLARLDPPGPGRPAPSAQRRAACGSR
jgi:hypothetical protein